MPIRQKILLYVFALLLIPFLFLGYIQSAVTFREIENILSKNTQQMLAQVELVTKFYISEMTQILFLAEESETIKDFLLYEESDGTREEIAMYLQTLESSNDAIQSSIILREDGSYISYNLKQHSRDSLSLDLWYRYAISKPNQLIFISNPVGRNFVSETSYDISQTISAIKALTKDNGDLQGILMFDFSLQELENRITPVTTGTEDFFYVVDQRGDIIYAPKNKVVHRIENKDILFNYLERNIVSIDNRLFQVMARPIEVNDWSVIGAFLYDDITNILSELSFLTILIFILTAIFAFLFSRIFNQILVNPITDLQKLMKKVEGGNFAVQFQKGYEDEIGNLGLGFNKMIVEIQNLLKIVEQKESQKRKAELQVLQEQIKPHFLYNTLDTISWMAIESDEHEIYKMVNALTEFFRISLNEGNEFITLEQELSHIKNYLVIQSMRYEKTFQYYFEVDEKLRFTSIIKLILQPLVENAIYHGIKEKGEQGELFVRVFREGEDIVMQISDNGKGLSAEKIAKLNTMFDTSSHSVGFGLANVNQRLKYHFGDEYRLRLMSNDFGGITVVLKHPIKNKLPSEVSE